jgi:hypothetical protein
LDDQLTVVVRGHVVVGSSPLDVPIRTHLGSHPEVQNRKIILILAPGAGVVEVPERQVMGLLSTHCWADGKLQLCFLSADLFLCQNVIYFKREVTTRHVTS